jgi:hypothetical protein
MDENWSKWMNFWRQEFFLGPNVAKNRLEVKKFAFWRNFANKKNTAANAT